MKLRAHLGLCLVLCLFGAAPAWGLDSARDAAPLTPTPAPSEPLQPDAAVSLHVNAQDVVSPDKIPDREQPIHVKANRIEINQKKSTTLYIGRVSFIQGGINITADRAEASYKGDKIDTVVATGNPVTLVQPSDTPGQDLHVSALRLEYHALDSKAVLSGKVRLQQGTNVVLCNTLHYDLAEGSLTAEGGEGDGADGRVAVTIESAAIEKPATSNAPPGAQKRKRP